MATLKENLEALEKQLWNVRFWNSKSLAEAALNAITIIALVGDEDPKGEQSAFETIHNLSKETAAMLWQIDWLKGLLHQATHRSDDHPAPDNCEKGIATEVAL